MDNFASSKTTTLCVKSHKKNLLWGGVPVEVKSASYESPSVSCFEVGMQECICTSPTNSLADEPDDYVYGGTL